jgi:transcriptional regulator with XRE-family HTH domain
VADPPDLVDLAAGAPSWNARVAAVRRVPEAYGLARHQAIYAEIAERVYAPSLTPDFGYVHWREEYELEPLAAAYRIAELATSRFANVAPADLVQLLREQPTTLRVFRLMLGLTTGEFAEATGMVTTPAIGKATIGKIETGTIPSRSVAEACAAVIDQMMRGQLFPPGVPPLRSKVEKTDTADGWDSVRRSARDGVPLPVLLHQRLYGGAFRQLLDATSSLRGDVIEEPVEALFRADGIPYIRTGAHNQPEIERRFGLTVRPAPDFVVYDDRTDELRAMFECKGANDGGTARDKAARFANLRTEANRLGGVPLFAVLGGIGWRRTNDALGPVVKATDGRVFTIATLPDMLTVEPLPGLHGRVAPV